MIIIHIYLDKSDSSKKPLKIPVCLTSTERDRMDNNLSKLVTTEGMSSFSRAFGEAIVGNPQLVQQAAAPFSEYSVSHLLYTYITVPMATYNDWYRRSLRIFADKKQQLDEDRTILSATAAAQLNNDTGFRQCDIAKFDRDLGSKKPDFYMLDSCGRMLARGINNFYLFYAFKFNILSFVPLI